MDRRQLLNDPVEAIRLSLDGRQAQMWTALPGIVTAVNLSEMTVSVQPAIQGVIQNEDGTSSIVNLPLLIHVPIVFPRAGSFTITFPIKVDDEVLVVFSSRCIDSWWQLGGIGVQMEARMHDLSDGFAIPGPTSQPNVIDNISSTDLQIRNDDGDTYVAITADGKIKLVSSTQVQINAPLAITGDITVTGKIDATGEIKSGLIPLTTHHHTGVTTGGGTSGPPVP